MVQWCTHIDWTALKTHLMGFNKRRILWITLLTSLLAGSSLFVRSEKPQVTVAFLGYADNGRTAIFRFVNRGNSDIVCWWSDDWIVKPRGLGFGSNDIAIARTVNSDFGGIMTPGVTNEVAFLYIRSPSAAPSSLELSGVVQPTKVRWQIQLVGSRLLRRYMPQIAAATPFKLLLELPRTPLPPLK